MSEQEQAQRDDGPEPAESQGMTYLEGKGAPSRTLATMGRIVHVYRVSPETNEIDAKFPAIVLEDAAVPGEGEHQTINAFAFDPGGGFFAADICLYDPDTVDHSAQQPAWAWAEWMPYQAGQAAKAEALQKELVRALERDGNPVMIAGESIVDQMDRELMVNEGPGPVEAVGQAADPDAQQPPETGEKF